MLTALFQASFASAGTALLMVKPIAWVRQVAVRQVAVRLRVAMVNGLQMSSWELLSSCYKALKKPALLCCCAVEVETEKS